MNIRKARKEDINSIISLNQQLFDNEYEKFDKTLDCSWPSKNRKYFENAISSKNFLSLVNILDGKIVGYLIGSINESGRVRKTMKIAELNNMLVIEKQRGKGIGRKLFEEFLKWAKERRAKRMRVVSSAKNIQAINFYKKCGFFDWELTLEKEI